MRVIEARAQDCCERCKKWAPTGERHREIHHRKNRSQGGTGDAFNCVALCRKCHMWITVHPEESYANGWSVHGWEDPTTVPLIDLFDNRWILEADGSRVNLPPIEAVG